MQDPDAEDAAQIVRTLSVHRHCGPKVRVIVELLKPEKAVSAIWDDTEHGIEIICLDIIRFKLLARRYCSRSHPISSSKYLLLISEKTSQNATDQHLMSSECWHIPFEVKFIFILLTQHLANGSTLNQTHNSCNFKICKQKYI